MLLAAKNIKGITVEIGGDTTKLNDALQTSDKSLRNTEKELKEVEKLLKLDPGNTVLLAQKQELLAKKVEESKNKLQTLRDVQEQVETQFKNGDIGEEQYRAFNRELEAAEINARDAQNALDNFGDEAKQTGNEVEKAGEKSGEAKGKVSELGEALKKAFTVTAIVAGVKKIANAIGDLGKTALDEVGSYEQLIGGVETLFGAASGEVLKYANKAYQTAGLSANQYMETVTSFSASLLQSLGGNTQKAAKMADMAITDMADNANKMGSDISTIQSAYAGFAKGQYTLLDNLKLGYGGTQKEMERLLKDADKINKQNGIHTKYQLSNYADIVDAIHVVQTNIGITGTTAKEASTTIQGSMSAAKAAWSNFLSGAGSADDLAQAWAQAGKIISTNLIGIGKRLGKQIPILISQSFDNIPDIAAELFPNNKALVKRISDISKTVKSFAQEIKNGIKPQLEDMKPLVDGVFKLINSLGKVAVPVLSAGFKILNPILKFANTVFGDMADSLADFVDGVTGTNTATYELKTAAQDATESWDELKESVSDNFGIDAQGEKLSNLKDRLHDIIDENGILIGSESELKSIMQQLKEEGYDLIYDAQKKQVKNEAEVRAAIDETIKKRLYEMRLAGMETLANAAYENRNTYGAEQAKALENEKKIIDEIIAEYKEYGLTAEIVRQNNNDIAKSLESIGVSSNGTTEAYIAKLNEAKAVTEEWRGKIESNEAVISAYNDVIAKGTAGAYDEAIEAAEHFKLANDIVAESGENLAAMTETELREALDGWTLLLEETAKKSDKEGANIALSGISAIVETYKKNGIAIPYELANRINDGLPIVKEVGATVPGLLADGIEMMRGKITAAGEGLGRDTALGYSGEMKNTSGAAYDAGKSVAQSGVRGLSSTSAYKLGSDLGNGYANGIESTLKRIREASARIANAAAKAIQKAQNSHSPSKVTQELGGYFGEGYAIGISDKIRDVQNASSRLVASAVAPVSTTSSITFNTNNTFNSASARDGATLIRQVNRQLGSIYGGRA